MPLLSEFPVAGPSGDGSGDMLAQIYDPTGQRRDIFGAFANRTLSNLTNPQQALSNLGAGVRPNLAVNCDFTTPVNTVGFTSGTYSSDFNILDRWTVQSFGGSITATLTEAGLQINTTASNQGLKQTISAKEISPQSYISSVIINGVLYSAKLDAAPQGVSLLDAVVPYPGSDYSCALIQYQGDYIWYPFVEYQAEPMEVTISHCKLEEGEGQTLAYEDESGALVILPQPDSSYAVQLLRCQMYGTSSIVGGIGASPRLNLLDNAYFVGGGSQQGGGQLPINQRGQTSYLNGTNSYTVDKWVSLRCNVSIKSEGLNIVQNKNVIGYFYQKLESVQSILAKEVTVSFLAKIPIGGTQYSIRWADDSISTNEIISLEPTGEMQLYTATFLVPSTMVSVGIYLGSAENPQEITVYAAKLEEGEGQTLAYQDSSGKWRLLPQPDMKYGAQLAECQRFLYVLKGQSWIGSGVMDNNTQGQFFIPLPVTMRTVPTISGTVRIYNQLNNVEATEISASAFSSNGVHGFLKIGSGSTLSSGDTVFLWLYTDEQLIISAEL